MCSGLWLPIPLSVCGADFLRIEFSGFPDMEDTEFTYALLALTVSLAFATYQEWRLSNSRLDFGILGGVATGSGLLL